MNDAVNGFLIASYLGAALLIVIIVDLVLVIRLRTRKAEREKRRLHQRIDEVMQLHEKEVLDLSNEAKEKERIRIAQELHDSLGGILNGIKLQYESMASSVEKLDENHKSFFNKTAAKVAEAVSEVRRISHDLHYTNVAKLGLENALRNLADEVNALNLVRVHHDFYELGTDIPYHIEINIYRIYQELLTNTLKHSNGTQAEIQIVRNTPSTLNILYTDNGQGFKNQILDKLKDTGVNGIEKRLKLLECTEYHFSGEHGVELSASIPIQQIDKQSG